MRWLFATLIFCVVYFQIGIAFALGNFPSYLTHDADFQRRTLGTLCYSMNTVEEHLPCNPAFLAREMDPHFELTGALGQNVSRLSDLNSVFDGHVSEATLRDIFSGDNELVVEGSVKTSFKSRLWGVSVTPYRAYSYSVIRNSAYPVLDIRAVKERSVNLQFASYLEEDFHMGAQIRYAHREIINKEVAMFDLLAEDGRDFLKSERQNAIYFEPGAYWAPEDSEVSASATLIDLGSVDHKIEGYTSQPKLQLGTAWTSPLDVGYFQTSLGTSFGEKPDVWEKHVRLGIAYGYGVSEWVASASRISQAAGLMIRFNHAKLGLTYNRNEIWEGDVQEAVFENFLTTFGFEL